MVDESSLGFSIVFKSCVLAGSPSVFVGVEATETGSYFWTTVRLLDFFFLVAREVFAYDYSPIGLI